MWEYITTNGLEKLVNDCGVLLGRIAWELWVIMQQIQVECPFQLVIWIFITILCIAAVAVIVWTVWMCIAAGAAIVKVSGEMNSDDDYDVC